MHIILFFLLLSIPNIVHSKEEIVFPCSTAGYLEEEGHDFYKDIATGVISKNNLSGNIDCKESYQKGMDAAKFYHIYGKTKNDEDKLIAQKAVLFKAKVRRFILEGIDESSK